MSEKSERVVITKSHTYRLDPGQTGTPAAQVLGEENARRLGLMNATVYDMPDGRRVMARPDDDTDAPSCP